MTNKNLLPLKFNVPIVGDVVFLTHGMKYNVELLLFCKTETDISVFSFSF